MITPIQTIPEQLKPVVEELATEYSDIEFIASCEGRRPTMATAAAQIKQNAYVDGIQAALNDPRIREFIAREERAKAFDTIAELSLAIGNKTASKIFKDACSTSKNIQNTDNLQNEEQGEGGG